MGTNLNQCEFPVKLLERKVRSKPHILHVNKALLLLLLITIPKPKGRSFDPFNGQLHCRVLSIFFSLESVTNCTPARRGLCCKMGSDKVNYLLWKILFLREKMHRLFAIYYKLWPNHLKLRFSCHYGQKRF